MKKNIDTTGRLLRLTIAILLIIYAWYESSWLALAFSLFVFFEATFSWCALNALLGKSSCPIDNEKKK